MTVTPLALPSPLPTLFGPDWAAEVSMEVAFSTDVQEGRATAAESRRGLVDRPYRTLSVRLSGMTQGQAAELWAYLRRGAGERLILPLYQDQAVTTATSSGTTINCPTARRRFFVGGRVAIYSLGAGGETSGAEYRIIASMSSTTITLTAALSSSHPAGSVVCPVIDVEASLEASEGVLEVDEVYVVAFEAREVPGPSALPPIVTGLPSGFPVYLGDPIINIDPNWGRQPRTAGDHPGESYGLGRGSVVTPRAARARESIDMEMLGLTRELAWPILEFAESRVGRLRPFWVANPQTMFEVVDVQSTHVDVEPAGTLSEWQDLLEWVAVVEFDGTVQVRGVSSIAVQGGDWRITFDSTISAPPLSEVSRVTAAHRCRMEGDAHTETWQTDGVAAVAFSLRELLDEGDAVVTDAVPSPFAIGPIADLDPYLWVDASGTLWSDQFGSLDAPTDPCRPWPEVIQGDPDQRVDFALDARQAPDDPTLVEPYLERYSSAETAPLLAYHLEPHRNNGLRTFYHFRIPAANLSGFILRNSQGKFWDDADGMTVFVCGRFAGPSAPVHDHLLRAGVFEWTTSGTTPSVVGHVKFFAVADVEVAAANITYDEPTDSTLRILAVRWDPGVSAEVFDGGGAALASAATPAAGLDDDPRDAFALRYSGNAFGSGDGLPQQPQNNLDRYAFTNTLIIFRRTLTDAEMDEVGQALALRYDLDWEAVV